MVEPHLYKSSSVFEMFGIDFVMDDNQKLWFIESNPSPQMNGTSPAKRELLYKTIVEMFEIEHAYLRSRWKRVTDLVYSYYREEGHK